MRALVVAWGLLIGVCAYAQVPADGGGRDVSVAMFSTHALRSVTIAPAGERAWVAGCLGCMHKSLATAVKMTAKEMFAGGTIRVTDDVSGETRVASGLWHFRATPQGEVDVVLTLPSERYVALVLQAEAAKDEPAESLRAMAILARTYALNGTHYQAGAGHIGADLCDSTQCQVMATGAVSAVVDEAVRATAGETLWSGRGRAEVFFSQSCGGITEDAGAVWPALRGVAYLKSHADVYCVRKDNAAWHAEIPLEKFARVATGEGWRVPAGIVSARVLERSESHRALRVGFTGVDGKTMALSATALRFGIGRALGWNLVRSEAYEVGVRNGALVFDGRGHGHGVGLCQVGAKEMAVEGKGVRDILAYYFPGTTVRILPNDQGWREVTTGALRVRAAEEIAPARIAQLQRQWGEAQRRFGPKRLVVPQIVFAPSTEVFRQMTGQPGWMLASTSGDTIVTQPESVLRKQDTEGTVLHEMLHVLVEAETSDKAPLWLREGLVELLAGGGGGISSMSVVPMTDGLAHAASLAVSQQAHSEAAAKVKGLVARYGMPVVRGWLVSGVPVGVS